MGKIKVVQIEGMEAAHLIGKIDNVLAEVATLKNRLIAREVPTIYLSRNEVAKMFSVSLVTIHEWTKKGNLKAYRLGNRVYFKRLEVDNAMIELQATRKGYNG